MKKNSSQRGFTLVELAIVLAIAGIVIAGILAAAAAVSKSNREKTANQDLLQIVQNIRNLYAGQSSMGSPTMAQLETAGVFPADVKTGTAGTLSNPWGGTIVVTPAGASFSVQFNGIPQASCVNMVTNSSASATDIGLTSVNTTTTFPISVSTALTICNNTTSTGNSITWTYNLRG